MSAGDSLNPSQKEAAEFDIPLGGRVKVTRPLLIIAGAGSGKTKTLAHRVARLISAGADPGRILLLTFTRRAAQEMTRRANRIVAAELSDCVPGPLGWAGTFHAIGNRLLRLHAYSIGLDPAFTVLDRSDAADLMNLVREDLGLSGKNKRFPQKATCLAVYSHTVNARLCLEDILEKRYPWCIDWASELKTLFGSYVAAKQRQNVLDYDDLLLYWARMVAVPDLGRAVGDRFDFVLVDEYQDTNAVQAEILLGVKPDGIGVTVVGDDAQAIYGFRAATVRNILDFPNLFSPSAAVITLERNYRATQAILDACNAVIALSPERFTKNLVSNRNQGEKPQLVSVRDEVAQVDYVVSRILAAREEGVSLRDQAVLFRTGHHSAVLEVELARRNIPFIKFGGLKFLEAAHIKDIVAVLRFAENPRDEVAGFRVLQLLPGIGPKTARRALRAMATAGTLFEALSRFEAPQRARADWAELAELLDRLSGPTTAWPGQIGRVREWYEPYLADLYEATPARRTDLEQLETIAGTYQTRERFLSEVTLDPPGATGDLAGPPLLDEDYLILSTIHSAKGQEWRAVYVLNVVDGCIPSDMACGSTEEIEEERRLLYVAMTRAKDELHLLHPQRFYTYGQPRGGDRHVYAPRSRFIPNTMLANFTRATGDSDSEGEAGATPASEPAAIDIATEMRQMWS